MQSKESTPYSKRSIAESQYPKESVMEKKEPIPYSQQSISRSQMSRNTKESVMENKESNPYPKQSVAESKNSQYPKKSVMENKELNPYSKQSIGRSPKSQGGTEETVLENEQECVCSIAYSQKSSVTKKSQPSTTMQNENSQLSYPTNTTKYSRMTSIKDFDSCLTSPSATSYVTEVEHSYSEDNGSDEISMEPSEFESSSCCCNKKNNKIEMKIKTDILQVKCSPHE